MLPDAEFKTPFKSTPAVHPAGLETVFSAGHQHHTRIYYDPKEGSYYDRATDLYLTLDEALAFGVG